MGDVFGGRGGAIPLGGGGGYRTGNWEHMCARIIGTNTYNKLIFGDCVNLTSGDSASHNLTSQLSCNSCQRDAWLGGGTRCKKQDMPVTNWSTHWESAGAAKAGRTASRCPLLPPAPRLARKCDSTSLENVWLDKSVYCFNASSLPPSKKGVASCTRPAIIFTH